MTTSRASTLRRSRSSCKEDPAEVAPLEPDPIAEIARERDEYLDSLQRLKAEFDNYRKRTAREQIELTTRAGERLVKELLPVLDDLERALEAAEQHEEAKLEDGVRLVHRALADVLVREGLSEIEADGRFDPNVHEALLAQPAETARAATSCRSCRRDTGSATACFVRRV